MKVAAAAGVKLWSLFLKALLAACGKGAYYSLACSTRETPAPRRSAPEVQGGRYIWGVSVVGRGRELREAGRLLDRAAGGAGGLLTFVGAPGSGKTVLAEAAADEARRRGFEVLRGSPPAGQPGRLVWAQLLRDAGGTGRTGGGAARPARPGRWTWTARPGTWPRRVRG